MELCRLLRLLESALRGALSKNGPGEMGEIGEIGVMGAMDKLNVEPEPELDD